MRLLIRRLFPALALLPILASCSKEDDFDVSGGLNVVRSTCPAVAIPAYTGDVSLFSPEQSQDARALDVTASITNLRTSCDQTGDVVHTKVTFDVVARRASPNAERDLILPYFSLVMRAGNRIVSKQVSQVRVHFADGQLRATGAAGAGADIQKSLATLPAIAQQRLHRKRKASDVDASIDPLADPKIKAAINEANFELLIGFQLTDDQLRYNATR